MGHPACILVSVLWHDTLGSLDIFISQGWVVSSGGLLVAAAIDHITSSNRHLHSLGVFSWLVLSWLGLTWFGVCRNRVRPWISRIPTATPSLEIVWLCSPPSYLWDEPGAIRSGFRSGFGQADANAVHVEVTGMQVRLGSSAIRAGWKMRRDQAGAGRCVAGRAAALVMVRDPASKTIC